MNQQSDQSKVSNLSRGMKKYILIFAILAFTLVVAVALYPKQSVYKTGKIQIGDSVFTVLISDTPELRTLGLSGRKMLSKDEAMLFVFEKAGLYGFWMKDMLFSIDIVWLDDEFRVVSMKKNVSPQTFPEVFNPTKSSKYVLEFSAGTLDFLSLKDGDQILFMK